MEEEYKLRCKKLFEPYSKKITLEGVMNWLLGEAQKRRISPDTAELAMAEVFVEIAQGKIFPTDGCKCGCGLTNPHSALVHYIRARMIKLHEKIMKRYIERIEDRIAKRIIRLQKKKSRWTNWNKSPTVKYFKAWERVFGSG